MYRQRSGDTQATAEVGIIIDASAFDEMCTAWRKQYGEEMLGWARENPAEFYKLIQEEFDREEPERTIVETIHTTDDATVEPSRLHLDSDTLGLDLVQRLIPEVPEDLFDSDVSEVDFTLSILDDEQAALGLEPDQIKSLARPVFRVLVSPPDLA